MHKPAWPTKPLPDPGCTCSWIYWPSQGWNPHLRSGPWQSFCPPARSSLHLQVRLSSSHIRSLCSSGQHRLTGGLAATSSRTLSDRVSCSATSQPKSWRGWMWVCPLPLTHWHLQEAVCAAHCHMSFTGNLGFVALLGLSGPPVQPASWSQWWHQSFSVQNYNIYKNTNQHPLMHLTV